MRTFLRWLGLFALILLTLAWLGLALHFLFLSAGPGASSPLGETIGGWLQLPCFKLSEPTAMYVIGCLEANEAGDYLAGFFAPLAFLWLAAAVFIQSSELREQRRELALTRNEFALNRQVATEQAEAAKAQADAARKATEMVAEQTSILRDEYESRLQYRALEMFQIKLKAAENALRAARFPLKGRSANVPATFDLDNLKPWLTEANNEIDKNGVLVAPTRWPEPAPIEKAMREVRALLDEATRHFENVSEVERARHNADLRKLQERVEKAEAGIGELARLGWSADHQAGSAEA